VTLSDYPLPQISVANYRTRHEADYNNRKSRVISRDLVVFDEMN